MDFPSSKPPTQLLFTRKLSRLFYWLQRCQKTKKEFFLTLMTGALVIYTTNFQLIQEINDEHFHGLISASPDKKHIVTANSFGEAHLYKKQEGSYSFKGSLAIAGSILAVDITNDLKLVVVESFQLFLFQYESGSFSLTETVAIGQSLNAASIDKSLQNILAINSSGYVFLEQESGGYINRFTPLSVLPLYCSADYFGNYFALTLVNFEVLTNFKCPSQCLNCSMPNNCFACKKEYVLEEGTCVPHPTLCVENIQVSPGICKEYCPSQCKTCKDRNVCFQCARLFIKNSEGTCVIRNPALFLASKLRFFMNLIKRGGFKFFFFIVDDLWLYSFHKQRYNGTMQEVLEIINLLEEKQWELLGLSEIKHQVENSIQELQEYNAYSNEKYMEIQRKNNTFIQSTIQYFVFFCPILLIYVFVCNRLFCLLFNYRISSLLRPYSFWAILIEIGFQSNIEYFTFLGFRSLMVPFFFTYVEKWFSVLTFGVFFCTTFLSFSSYALYYSLYGKLARYFLVNMYRFPSSYALMIILYGVRPFLKGVVHALFYKNFVIQLWMLISIEIVMIFITLFFQYFFQNHKNKKILVLEILSMASLVALNLLLLLKFEYYAQQESKAASLEAYIELVLYFMFLILVLRLFIEVIVESTVWEFLREACCRTSQVTPMNLEQQKQEDSEPSILQRASLQIVQFLKKKMKRSENKTVTDRKAEEIIEKLEKKKKKRHPNRQGRKMKKDE